MKISEREDAGQTESYKLLRFFSYEHFPEDERLVPKAIEEFARMMVSSIPDSSEKTHGMRKLLEARDCLIRAVVFPSGKIYMGTRGE